MSIVKRITCLLVCAAALVVLPWNRHASPPSLALTSRSGATKRRRPMTDDPPPSRRRLVLLAGPHKTASTTIQKFLRKLDKKGLLADHEWSYLNGRVHSPALVPKTLLVPPHWRPSEHQVDDKSREFIHKMGRQIQQSLNTTSTADLVWAQENWDILAALSDNNDASPAVRRMWGWLGTDHFHLDAVVMFRSPRVDHLISMWKESMQFRLKRVNYPWRIRVFSTTKKNRRIRLPSLAEWLCTGIIPRAIENNVTLQLSTWINPWGLARALYQRARAMNGGNHRVTLVDMAGVVDQDVSSVVACEFLNLPCKNVHVNTTTTAMNHADSYPEQSTATPVRRLDLPGFTYPMFANAKKWHGPLGFSANELAQAEEMLRDMDCYYYCELGKSMLNGDDDAFFRVLFPTDSMFDGGLFSSWKRCCQRSQTAQSQHGSPLDGAATARRLRSMACRAHERNATRDTGK